MDTSQGPQVTVLFFSADVLLAGNGSSSILALRLTTPVQN